MARDTLNTAHKQVTTTIEDDRKLYEVLGRNASLIISSDQMGQLTFLC
jgi:hypothetical protein